MDSDLKEPLERLAEALHRAIAQSDDVDAALAGIRAAGFEASLLLEVTVALDRGASGDGRQMDFADVASHDGMSEWIVEVDGTSTEPHGSLADRVAPADRDFLRSIRIRLD